MREWFGGKKFAMREADGGSGSDVRLTRPESSVTCQIDLLSQARKALSERSPFDVAEEGSNVPSSVPTLPGRLGSLVRQAEGRKRHKKLHLNAETKAKRASERGKGGSLWVEAEDYFRDLALPDVDTLYELCDSLGSLARKKCFFIPYSGDEAGIENVVHGDTGIEVVTKEEVEGVNEPMDIDGGGVNAVQGEESYVNIDQELRNCDSGAALNSGSGLEWVLGCRNRVFLNSERPSKKRKLLGSDAGLEKVMVTCCSEGSHSVCDFCCKGDTGKDSNQLMTCSSCKVTVHQGCYGKQDASDSSWLCSWCRQKDSNRNSGNPCLLCPRQGGALKPVHKTVESGPKEFAHLFCSLWMPEVYIEDLRKMEPVINLEGIPDTRKKIVCNICKVKCGACLRCSHGSCRSSFHPICAREAKNRMEIWGKFGIDNVELRAFCSKHSVVVRDGGGARSGENSGDVGSDSHGATNVSMTVSPGEMHKTGHKNGDGIAVHDGMADSCSDKSENSEFKGTVLSESPSSTGLISDVGYAHEPVISEKLEKSSSGNSGAARSLNIVTILRKLVDRGRVNINDVASEIGMTPDSLDAALTDGSLAPELQSKLFEWFKNHAYLAASERSCDAKVKPTLSCKTESGVADDSDSLTLSESDAPDVKSVPPRRRTKSNIRITKDKKTAFSSMEMPGKNERDTNETDKNQLVSEETHCLSNISIPDGAGEDLTEDDLKNHGISESQGKLAKAPDCSISDRCLSEGASFTEKNNYWDQVVRNLACPVVMVVPDLTKMEAPSRSYAHPYICKLWEMQNGSQCSRDGTSVDKSSTINFFYDLQNCRSTCSDKIDKAEGSELEKLVKARKMGVLDLSPEDEVEGEIIYFQQRLLNNSVGRKQLTDNLVFNVAKRLPHEIDSSRRRRWDVVLVNQYLCELREAKKQGRKERRHKEAQAVLAAATAAVASSSRTSAFRKDVSDDLARQEIKPNGRDGLFSQPMPWAKETLSRVAAPTTSLEKHSDHVQSRLCDICRRPDTILNPILVCSSCKVAVHLDCYRSVKESTGPWRCELCEELSSEGASDASTTSCVGKTSAAECVLCGGDYGAFRKTNDGHWVHAFCAEWVLESTFRRGQVNPVEGMDMVPKGAYICSVCGHERGVCIKCNYGNCQTLFHPPCARNAGFFMNVKAAAGRLQHKAYCEKHSLEQRAKAETQRDGIEELRNARNIRVGLEKLRLLCERIVKREKVKREIVCCTNGILAARRDCVTYSSLLNNSFLHPDVSSDSATTSLKGHSDGYRSGNEITVDSSMSAKRQRNVYSRMDSGHRIDDSSTSQNVLARMPSDRIQYSGKQIPRRHQPNLLDDRERRGISRKHSGTFGKELVMTSDQASMKNQLLPKGFIYVPIDSLPKESESE